VCEPFKISNFRKITDDMEKLSKAIERQEEADDYHLTLEEVNRLIGDH